MPPRGGTGRMWWGTRPPRPAQCSRGEPLTGRTVGGQAPLELGGWGRETSENQRKEEGSCSLAHKQTATIHPLCTPSTTGQQGGLYLPRGPVLTRLGPSSSTRRGVGGPGARGCLLPRGCQSHLFAVRGGAGGQSTRWRPERRAQGSGGTLAPRGGGGPVSCRADGGPVGAREAPDPLWGPV